MSNFTKRSATTPEFWEYPTFTQVLAYAENFRRGARSAYRKFKNYAAFRHSSSLKVAVRRLAWRFYEVRAYPFYDPNNPALENQHNGIHYMAWLLTYDSKYRHWACFLDREAVDEHRYRRCKRRIGRPVRRDRVGKRLLELISHPFPIQPIYSKRGHIIAGEPNGNQR